MKLYRDLAGDGGSRVVAQMEAQRSAIDEALSAVRHLVAVGSGKGGVGKSTLTAAMARALAQSGRRVAILDADFNGPCQAQLAGLQTAPWIPGEGGLTLPRSGTGVGVISFGSLLPDAQALEHDSVAEGEEQTWRATREFALLGQLLSAVRWGELDLLLLDLPPGAERLVQFAHLLGSRAAFVLVTIPSDLARGVVARSVSALTRGASPVLGYIENMAGYFCRDCGEIRPLFPSSSNELGIPCLGTVPFDPELAIRCDRGRIGTDEDDLDLASTRAMASAADRILEILEA